MACEDNLLGSRLMAQTLTHELVHAYDQCRAKINFDSCYHYACTEVGLCADASTNGCRVGRAERDTGWLVGVSYR